MPLKVPDAWYVCAAYLLDFTEESEIVDTAKLHIIKGNFTSKRGPEV